MGQIYSGLGKKVKLCVRKARFLDDDMDKFGHTPKERGAFAHRSRRKCSKLQAVPCAFLLIGGQNRLRLNNFLK